MKNITANKKTCDWYNSTGNKYISQSLHETSRISHAQKQKWQWKGNRQKLKTIHKIRSLSYIYLYITTKDITHVG